jgi:hypothetical protein
MRSQMYRFGDRLVRSVLVSLLFGAGGLACAQVEEKPIGTKAPKTTGKLASTVASEKDVATAFKKLEAALRQTTGSKAPLQAPVVNPSSKPASREQIILVMNGLYEMAKPEFKYTPKMIAYDPAVLTIAKSSPALEPLKKLIAWQCVGKIGPLAANLKTTLTLEEFGDALGFFSLRIADLTHMPSNKWSPYIKELPPEK